MRHCERKWPQSLSKIESEHRETFDRLKCVIIISDEKCFIHLLLHNKPSKNGRLKWPFNFVHNISGTWEGIWGHSFLIYLSSSGEVGAADTTSKVASSLTCWNLGVPLTHLSTHGESYFMTSSWGPGFS